MTTNSLEELQSKIERLVHDHLAEQHRAAMAAVERGFANVATPNRGRETRPSKGRRRARSEMSELADRKQYTDGPGAARAAPARPRARMASGDGRRVVTRPGAAGPAAGTAGSGSGQRGACITQRWPKAVSMLLPRAAAYGCDDVASRISSSARRQAPRHSSRCRLECSHERQPKLAA